MTTTATQPALREMTFDHLEFYVGNALQAAYYYCAAFGFDVVAYGGPETGLSDRASYVLKQNALIFVVTESLRGDGDIAEHVRRHGDGIKDVALTVRDAKGAFEAAVAAGAVPVSEPKERSDDEGRVVTAAIGTYGDVVHTFVERGGYRGIFLPRYVAAQLPVRAAQAVGLCHIDHCV